MAHLEAETKILHDLEVAVYNEFRQDVKRKFERHSRGSLFLGSEVRRSSKLLSVRKKSTSLRKQLLRPNLYPEGNDEIDLGNSNEMVDLSPIVDQGYPTSRSPKIVPVGSATYLHQEDDKEMETFSPDKDILVKLSPSSKRKSLPPKEISQRVKSLPTSTKSYSSSLSSQRSTVVQQDLDFDLDVTVNIESGKCVFHLTSGTKIDVVEPRFVYCLFVVSCKT